MNNTENKEYYRVLAHTLSRDPYPVYKYYNDPEEWSCNGTVIVSCKDGVVNVKILENDSINIHHLTVNGSARLTEQLSHPERP